MRTAPILAVAAALLGLSRAPAQVPAPTPAPAQAQSFRFDATAYGASTAAADNGPAIQAAVDAAAAALAKSKFTTGTSPVATVYLPGATAPYWIRTPVHLDASSVGIRGDGVNTQLVTPAGCAFTPIYVGVPRVGGGRVPDATFRPDLFGRLDASAAPAAGARWGIRTNGDLYGVAQAGSLSHGPQSPTTGVATWRETRRFTVEFAIEGFAAGKVPGNLDVLGVGNIAWGSNTAADRGVFLIRTSAANTYRLYLHTQAARFGPATSYTFDVSSGAATGVQRIAFQVDLDRGTVSGFANGVQAPVAVGGGPLPPGSTLNENQYFPFTIASAGDGIHGNQSGADFGLYGLAVSLGRRYAENGPGTPAIPHPQLGGWGDTATLTMCGNPAGGTFTLSYGGATSAPIQAPPTVASLQAAIRAMSFPGAATVNVYGGTYDGRGTGLQYQIQRVDGVGWSTGPGMCDGSALTGPTVKDLYRYFPEPRYYPYVVDNYVLAYLPFTESPSGAPRQLATGGVAQCPLLLMNGNTMAPIAIGNTIKDISITVGGPYGMGIALGHSLGTTLDGVTSVAGIYGAGNYPWGANYYNQIKGCFFQGGDANYFAHSSIIEMDDCWFNNNGRYCLRLLASSIRVRNLTVGNYGYDPCAFAAIYSGDYGGRCSFEGVSLDFEGGADLALALFYAEATAYTKSNLTVKDVYGGSIGTAPAFKLRGMGGPPVWPMARFDASHIDVNALGGVVDTDGPNWTGRVADVPAEAAAYVTGPRTSGRPAIVVTDSRLASFPRHSDWSAGTARIEPPAPSDGQYQVLRVVGDGVHGSASPPQWAGSDPLRSGDSAMAAYAIGHTAISATLSGQPSSRGHLTTAARAALAATLFGGQPQAMPPTWYVGLSTLDSTVSGTRAAEPRKATGYARVALPNTSASFAASSAGRKASAADVVFPAATAPYAVRAITFYPSATSTEAWAVVQLASPLTVTAGTTPTIPAGSLTFARTPYVGQFCGGPTAYGWGRVYDGLFGGAALAPPASWYVGLASADEPTDGGYARVAVPNAAASWLATQTGNPGLQAGDVRNAAAVAFPPQTAPWGATAAILADAPAGGNAWFRAPLVQPAPGAAPALAPGAFTLGVE